MAAPLQNVYYERKVGTAKPCYICRRETTTVLATLKTEDFLYTCDGHLSDPGFASLISAPPAAPPGPTPEHIKKVIADYHAREAKKSEKGKDDKAKDESEKNEGDGSKAKPASPGPPVAPISVPTASPAQTHKKYALHRQIFDMRKMEIKKKEQGAKAKEVGRGLPQVPRGNF